MQQSIEAAQVGGRILMIGVLSGFEQQIAIPNIFGTRREASTAPCPGRGGSLSGTQNCENNPMQSRNGPHTIQKRKGPPAPRRGAERVLAAFDASATGVVQIDGVMLDAPHRARAHRIMTSFERG